MTTEVQPDVSDVQDAEIIEETPAEEQVVQISLAKANKLRNKLESYLNDLEAKLTKETHSSIIAYPGTDFDSIKEESTSKKTEIRDLFQEFGNINELLTNIRTVISMKNAECGVDHTMARIEAGKRALNTFKRIFEMSRLTPFSEKEIRFNIDQNSQLRDAIDNSKGLTSSLSRPAKFNVPLYSKEEIDSEILGIRSIEKSISDLEEHRNSLNYSNTISLAKDAYEWLEGRKLV